MKQLLNVLYITNPESYIRRDGTNVVIYVDNSEIGRIPIHNIQQIVCFGYAGASTGIMSLCVENNVTLTYMSPNGRYIASIIGETKGNVLLRRSQYRIADDETASLQLSRNMIRGKLINCRSVLKKGLSNHPDIDDGSIAETISLLSDSIEKAGNASDSSELRGIEGESAKAYFHSLDRLILKNHEMFYMKERSRRPPRDRFNSLLSFVYSLLTNDVRSSLESVGLDPYVGFLHTDRPGRPSLALDLMEEFRPIADRFSLRLVNLGMITSDGFIKEDGGAFQMNEDTRKTVISEWQKYKNSQIEHLFLEETLPLGLVPFVQSALMAKTIRKDLNGYPPFIIKR